MWERCSTGLEGVYKRAWIGERDILGISGVLEHTYGLF